MTTRTRRIACFCESTFDAEMPESADLAAEPGVEETILGGDFMAVTCPACGKRLTPEFPFRLTGVKGVGEIFLVPETDRAGFLLGKLAYDVGAPGRVAIGFRELAEKVLIASQDQDDRVIEMMKYYLLTRASAPSPSEGAGEITIVYRGLDAGRHLFHIIGMKEGEVGVARLAPELYQKIASDVESRVAEEPFRDFCVPPWVSLRRVAGGLS
jgi:hypothetical protein